MDVTVSAIVCAQSSVKHYDKLEGVMNWLSQCMYSLKLSVVETLYGVANNKKMCVNISEYTVYEQTKSYKSMYTIFTVNLKWHY